MTEQQNLFSKQLEQLQSDAKKTMQKKLEAEAELSMMRKEIRGEINAADQVYGRNNLNQNVDFSNPYQSNNL